jgi:hypothetical protein
MRTFEPLPIDAAVGFPQSFPLLFHERTYRFTFYVDVAADLLPRDGGPLPLPGERAFLVARVERGAADGTFETILLRKVLPNVVYEAGDIALRFDSQRIARENLNGRGEFGSLVRAGIADRWA